MVRKKNNSDDLDYHLIWPKKKNNNNKIDFRQTNKHYCFKSMQRPYLSIIETRNGFRHPMRGAP